MPEYDWSFQCQVTGCHCSRRAAFVWMLPLLTLGCSSAPVAQIPATPEALAIRSIESIALLPVVFPGNQQDPRLTKVVFEALTLNMAEKGYVLERADGLPAATEVGPQLLQGANAERLAALLPASADYFLLCWVDELSKEESILSDTAAVRLSAVLLDRRHQRVMWRNSIKREEKNTLWNFSSGFMLTFVRWLVDDSTQLSVLSGGFRSLLAGFPAKPMR